MKKRVLACLCLVLLAVPALAGCGAPDATSPLPADTPLPTGTYTATASDGTVTAEATVTIATATPEETPPPPATTPPAPPAATTPATTTPAVPATTTPAAEPTATNEPTPLPTETPQPTDAGETDSDFVIWATAFDYGGTIPTEHTCDGADTAPELWWRGAPEGTVSLVLLVDDLDAPGGLFNHWVMFNIPGEPGITDGLDAGTKPVAETNGAVAEQSEGLIPQGRNDFGTIGWGGPCPPPGNPHRYVFSLFALDYRLDLPVGATRAQVMAAMGCPSPSEPGNWLERTETMGTFGR